MSTVAVVAHTGKRLGGGLPELRRALTTRGVTDPIWLEVAKSRAAPRQVRHALEQGARLVFVWGGDGMVQRCVDTLAGRDGVMAVVPAGTANLLATNLGIPKDVEGAVDVGLRGARRRLDLGRLNGEHFAVMAGTGFDALMIRDADRSLKDRVGRLAYVWTGARHLGSAPVRTRIRVDGAKWFSGDATCVLVGNVGRIFGGVTAFDGARPDDGRLELGVVTANGVLQWARALTRTAAGRAERSPFVQTKTFRKAEVRLARKMPYELDGGDRSRVDRLKIRVVPEAITVCVPREDR